MFQTFVGSGQQTRKPWAVFAAFVFQAIGILALMLVPMIWYDAIPGVSFQSALAAPPPPPAPPPPASLPPIKVAKVIPRQWLGDVLMAPKKIPEKVAMIKEEELPPAVSGGPGVVGSPGVPGSPGGPGNILTDLVSRIPPTAAPPPPVKKAAEERPATPQRIKQGGNVQQAMLIHQVRPDYPQMARQIRVEGTVRLSAVISKEGRILQLEAISGHPFLVPAAIGAVKQWVYRPTLLNGEPVEVVTQIDVNFTLSKQ